MAQEQLLINGKNRKVFNGSLQETRHFRTREGVSNGQAWKFDTLYMSKNDLNDLVKTIEAGNLKGIEIRLEKDAESARNELINNLSALANDPEALAAAVAKLAADNQLRTERINTWKKNRQAVPAVVNTVPTSVPSAKKDDKEDVVAQNAGY